LSNEKLEILELIQSGKITASEGLELLKALDDSFEKSDSPPDSGSRSLRILITDGPNKKVNVNIPIKLFKVATKFANMGMKLVPEEARQEMRKKGVDLSNIDFDELINLIDQGMSNGKLVDINTEGESGGHSKKVEIYVE